MEFGHPASAPSRDAFVASFVTLSGAGFAEPARHSFEDRVAAAREAGFTGVGIHVDDVAGVDGEEMRRRDEVLGRAGLWVGEIEFLSGWSTGTLPDTRTTAFQLAARWGAHHVSIGEFAQGRLEVPTSASALAQLADEAAQHSVTLALEAFPWSSIDSYSKALELIETSGAKNVGLLVDIWHFFNSGGELSLLDRLEPRHIAAVQLNDGPRVTKDFLHQARNTRMLPGHGELDVVGLVERLLTLGYQGPWFLEVNTPQFRRLAVGEAAEQAVAAGRRAVEAARMAHANPSK